MINELNAAQIDTVGGGLRINLPQALTANLDLRTGAEMVAILLVSMCPEFSFIKNAALRFIASSSALTVGYYSAHRFVNWAIDHGMGDLIGGIVNTFLRKNDSSSSEEESPRSVNL